MKDFKGNDPRFCYFLLKSLDLEQFNVGSGVPTLNRNHVHPLPVFLPPLPEQRAIAHILGTLDDKIELNRRMNETLEAMARALFKSWFVDFDPVRATMAGRDTGLPKHLADLFPARLVDSELGKIPEGWIVRTLGDLCHKPQYGYTASAQSEPVGARFLRITDINKESWVSWSRVPYCEATDDELSRYRLSKGDVLIARMADPGHGILVEEDLEAVFASYLIRFKPIDNRNARLLQYWLKSDAYWQLVRGRGRRNNASELECKGTRFVSFSGSTQRRGQCVRVDGRCSPGAVGDERYRDAVARGPARHTASEAGLRGVASERAGTDGPAG